MKKTVIKRRKRVPAAPGVTTGRISDQAAAEALVAVGRSGHSPGVNNEESDDEQPKRKRTRRSAARNRTDKDDDVIMDGEDDDDPISSTRKRRLGNTNGWPDSGRSASPYRSRNFSGLVAAPFPVVGGGVLPPPGFELPPLASLNPGATFLGSASAPSSYIRSGSNAPSRTHSPLGQFSHYTSMQPPYPPPPPSADMSSLMVAAGVALGGLGIPSYMDLERHYIELSAHKRKWEEMIEKTERLMAGMKRAMDEMRGLAAQQAPSPHILMMPPSSLQQTHLQSPQHPTGSPVAPAAAGPSSKAPSPTHMPQHFSAQKGSPQLAAANSPAIIPLAPLNKPASPVNDRERTSAWPVVESGRE